MQDLLRRMRLREELLSGTEKAPAAGAERNLGEKKQIGAILLPQNLHLAPVVRNHETPPEQISSDSKKEVEGGQTRSERIAEQLGRFHDGYQKYRHPLEYAQAQAKEKLHQKFMEKAQEKLGAERFAKLQKHAAAYQKYRHPVQHVKRKAKQAVKKVVKRLIPLWVKVWLVVIALVSFSLVMLIATIWNSMSGLDKFEKTGKATACATTGVGCESLWSDTFSEGTMRNMLGALSPGSAEGSIPPSRQSTSRGTTLGTRNDFERYLYNNGFVLKDATVDVSGINPNFEANLVRLKGAVFGGNSPYGPIEITSGIDSHDTGAHVIGNAVDISVNRGSGAAFWTALTQTPGVQMGSTSLGPTATFEGVRCMRESNPPHIHCSQDS